MKRELDTTGLKCPLPVLRARRELEEMAGGELLALTADDPVAVTDVPAFCRMVGHRLVMVEDRGGSYYFEIEKDAGVAAESVTELPRLAIA